MTRETHTQAVYSEIILLEIRLRDPVRIAKDKGQEGMSLKA